MSFRENIVDPIVVCHKKNETIMSKMHYHSAYEIHISESERKYLVSDQLMHLKERDVLLIKPDVIHRSITKTHLCSSLELPIIYLERYFTEDGIKMITKCFEKSIIRVRESDFKQLLVCVEKFNDDKNDILSLNQIFYILKNNMSRETHSEEFSDSLASRIVDFVTENYKTIDNLEVITNMFFISKSYLCALFKGYTGTSIMNYINCLKIHHSIDILSRTNISIEDVAIQSGFSSLANFSQTFKSVIGISPLKYRKKTNDSVNLKSSL